jgi:cysteine desulfurase
MLRPLFLDANAHLPMSSDVLKSYKYFQSTLGGYGHPLSPNLPGRKAAQALEQAREKIAKLLGAESSNNIIFTSSCTQACEWGITILYDHTNDLKYSSLEHSAVRSTFEKITQDQYISNYRSIYKLKSTRDGIVIPEKANGIACIYVQNELGTIQPLEKLNANIIFSDMCQAVGKIKFNLSDMHVDIAAFGAHKWGGPTGVGILYLKDINLYREFGTGSRYQLDRTGTPDVASIVAAAEALEIALNSMDERVKNMKEFQDLLEFELMHHGIDVLCKNSPRVPNTTFIRCPNSFDILTSLGDIGIHVGLGSACGGILGSSPVIESIGECGNITDFLRISTHGEYGKNEAAFVADNLIKRIV